MTTLNAVADWTDIVMPTTEAELTAALHLVSVEIMRLAGSLHANQYGADEARATRDEQSIRRQRKLADALIDRLLSMPLNAFGRA
jgi:hypothetical protein